MRLIMTLLVRDEEDIVRQNILYHLRMGVDFVIATDNKSVDDTVDILREFESQRVLHLIREQQDNYAQGAWVSRMARMAKARFNADWVINGDADEFWWPISGNLSETLGRIPNDYDVVSAPRYNFVPRSAIGTVPWYESMVCRETNSTNTRGRPLPPKVCHRGIENIKIAQGNHHILWPRGLAVFPQPPIEVLHFPLRSYAQFENKIVKGGSAYERNTDLRTSVGRDWRRLYRRWKKGKLYTYYQQQIWPDIRLQRGIDNGSLVPDTRLQVFFQANGIA
jgi:hypothetical protein